MAHKRASGAGAGAAPHRGHTIERRMVAAIGGVALLVVVALSWVAWRWLGGVLAEQPEHLYAARQVVLLGAAMLLGLIELSLLIVSRFVSQRVTEPAAALAEVAERVTGGDLTVPSLAFGIDDEMGRLERAVGAMIAELRRLVRVLHDAAREAAAMSHEITAGTEEMSAAASEMAHTSSDLSHQSSEMASAIAQTAGDAALLMDIAARLSAGSEEGVERNMRLRQLAEENRARLDASGTALDQLGADAETSAAATEAVAMASEEILAFVTLVRRIARQSKLLALNASMEAARAGEQAEGFAAVAQEIRRLSASSAEAAERAEGTIGALLARVEDSRASSRRTIATLGDVRQTTAQVLAAFAGVERAVQESEGWMHSIEDASRESGALIERATQRLDRLAAGTESFAAAMEEVAAGAQQQSAGSQEIAAAAAALAGASRRLLELVSAFRLEAEMTPEFAAAPTAEMPVVGGMAEAAD